MFKRWVKRVGIAVCAWCMGAAYATTSASTPQADLREVQTQIREIQRDIRKKEENRNEVADALKASETAISEARRALSVLERHRRQSENEQQRVQRQIRQSRKNIAHTQQKLHRILRAQYRAGQHESLRLWLSQKNPNEVMRYQVYQRHIARAQKNVITHLNQEQRTLKTLSARLSAEREQLKKVSAEHQEQAARFEKEKRVRAQVFHQLSDQIRSQQQQVGKLQQDEQRLTALVAGINRALEQRQRQEKDKLATAIQPNDSRRRSKRDEAVVSTTNATSSSVESKKSSAEPRGDLTADDAQLQPSSSRQSFVAQKSGMRLPAKGTITAKFGAERSQGARWRGIFIKARAGQPVQALASGRVVYADWLRGFGNMIIIDHGDTYMSIYAGVESTLKKANQTVRQHESIATTGSSGGSEQSGVYFEIRHRGQPVNPQHWVNGVSK